MVQFYPWFKFYFLCFGYGNLMIMSLKQRINLNHNISTLFHSDEGLTLETSVFEFFTVANLPYRPCG